MSNNQLVLADIAAGNVDSTGASGGDKLQGTLGCVALKGGTGLILVTLDAPNNGLTQSDVVVNMGMGFNSSKSPGGFTATMSTLVAGAFTVSIWDQTTVPPALIDGSIHFVIKRKYQNQ